MARLFLENLLKSFAGPRHETIGAVRDLNLTVEDGELLALVGPSGCGKTTTLRLVAGLEAPDRGQIFLDGKSWSGVEAKDRDVAMVFQNHALFPHMTVFENMALGLRLRKFPAQEVAARVGETAERLGLTGLLERRPAELSGGEAQRAALGRALARRPQVLLFDEPLSNLDAPLRLQLRGEIARLRRPGRAMLLVTHDQAEALALGDRVAVMKEGAIQQVATPRELYDRPANRFVAAFIGSPPMNFFEGHLVERAGRLCFQARGEEGFADIVESKASGALTRHTGGSIILGLRPEHITLSGEADGPGQAQAVLERVESAGADCLWHFARGSQRFAARAAANDTLRPGASVALHFSPDGARFFDSATGAAIAD